LNSFRSVFQFYDIKKKNVKELKICQLKIVIIVFSNKYSLKFESLTSSEEHKLAVGCAALEAQFELKSSSLKLRLSGGSAAQNLPQAQLISSSP
jgi:hypothetical protein